VTVTTLSGREFNQDTSKAKKAAAEGPVFITDRGQPSHVLLTIEAYQKLTGSVATIGNLLALPGIEDMEFDPPRLTDRPPPPGGSIIMYLLDTNVVSELRKVAWGKADKNVIAWNSTATAASLYLSAIVIHELELGVLLMERRDPTTGALFRA